MNKIWTGSSTPLPQIMTSARPTMEVVNLDQGLSWSPIDPVQVCVTVSNDFTPVWILFDIKCEKYNINLLKLPLLLIEWNGETLLP